MDSFGGMGGQDFFGGGGFGGMQMMSGGGGGGGGGFSSFQSSSFGTGGGSMGESVSQQTIIENGRQKTITKKTNMDRNGNKTTEITEDF